MSLTAIVAGVQLVSTLVDLGNKMEKDGNKAAIANGIENYTSSAWAQTYAKCRPGKFAKTPDARIPAPSVQDGVTSSYAVNYGMSASDGALVPECAGTVAYYSKQLGIEIICFTYKPAMGHNPMAEMAIGTGELGRKKLDLLHDSFIIRGRVGNLLDGFSMRKVESPTEGKTYQLSVTPANEMVFTIQQV